MIPDYGHQRFSWDPSHDQDPDYDKPTVSRRTLDESIKRAYEAGFEDGKNARTDES